MKRNPTPLDLNGTGYCASFNFRKTARAVTRLYDVALQESGIRSTQFAILVAIAKKHPISMGALGELLVIDSTTLTRSLRLLQKAGLVTISNRAAKRQRFLSLTNRGENTLARAVPLWRKAQERFEATIGTEHWVELRKELERLAGIAVNLEKPPKDLPAEMPSL